MTESKKLEHHGRRMTLSVRTSASPQQVYAAWADPERIAHWFVDRRIARISPKLHPEDARWYARVLAEGPVEPGDRVEVNRIA